MSYDFGRGSIFGRGNRSGVRPRGQNESKNQHPCLDLRGSGGRGGAGRFKELLKLVRQTWFRNDFG